MSAKNIRRKYIKLLLISIVALALAGCSKEAQSFVETDMRDMVTNRMAANQMIAKQLHDSGLMDKSEYDLITKSIKEKEKELVKANDGEKGTQKPMFNSLASFNTVPWKEDGNKGVNSKKYKLDDWNDYIVTNAINKYYTNIDGKKYLNILENNGTVVPISIIDEAAGSEINKRFGYKIYVLKKSADILGDDTERALDEVSEMIEKAISEPEEIKNQTLERYFEEAKDKNDKPVTLLDISKRENQLVVVSDARDIGEDEKDVEHPDSKGSPNKVLRSQLNDKKYTGGNYSNRPGKDMVIKQEGFKIMSMRFKEFNQDAVDNVIKTLGLSDDKYLVVPDQKGGRVYLMEYPVHHISKFKEDKDSYKAEFKQSNLGINLRTGTFVKYSGAWDAKEDGKSTSGVTTVKNDPYLSLKGAKNSVDTTKASFVLLGDTKMEVGQKDVEVKTGRIVLRDYLEATYAPGVVAGETTVLFGRKIRVENFSGSKDREVANFYNKKGDKLDNIGGGIFISDITDIDKLTEPDSEVRFIKGKNEADIKKPASADPDDDDDTDLSVEDLIENAIQKIDRLPIYTDKEIVASLPFPSEKLGRIDNEKESETPLFYAMAVKKGMFETGLFSGWIHNTEEEGNSLSWWNDWLKDHKYQYKIDKTILEDYLTGNYAHELGEEGILVLDLETIAKIQEEYNQQDNITKNRKIRTVFMLLGAILLGYSTLILVAWVLDTNVDMGLNILEKMTFGHMIAVSDESQTPQYDTEHRRYIGFGNLFIRSICLATVGIVIILVDFMQIGLLLVQIFGGVARMITNTINNL